MPSNYHLNRRLTDRSACFPYKSEPIGKRFFPEAPTDKLSDQFAQMSKANLLGLQDASPIGDTGLPSTVDVVYDADTTFNIPIYGLRIPDKWITSKNADPALAYQEIRLATITQRMRIFMEYIRINRRLRLTSVMTTNKTLLAAERFDNFGSPSSLPLSLLQSYRVLLSDRNDGRPPNQAMCAIQTVLAIAKSEEFKDYVKYTAIVDQRDIQANPLGAVPVIEQFVGLPRGSLSVYDATYNAGTLVAPSYKKYIGSDFVMAYVEPFNLMSWTATVGWRWSELPEETSVIEAPDYSTMVPTTEMRVLAAFEPQVIKPELAVLIKGCVDTAATGNTALD
jgi:hypothetical protein